MTIFTPTKEGYEAGIMRRKPMHSYLTQTTMARQYMNGFKRGQERRAWLDARGMKRVQNVIVKNGSRDWHWQLLVECIVQVEGSAKSEKLAAISCETAAFDCLAVQISHK